MSSSAPFSRILVLFFLLAALLFMLSGCGAGPAAAAPPSGQTVTPSKPQAGLTGVLQWKGDPSGSGNYASETKLTPANVNAAQFGKLAEFAGDGDIIAQPLYVAQLDLGGGNLHNTVIFATENNSVYAYDADSKGGAQPLWVRHYNVNGATSAPDNYGGRTTLGGQVGITGTPVIDAATGAMYFVTMQALADGSLHQYLRAIDVHTGKDFGPGTVEVSGSVPGDGVGSSGGQIAFNTSVQNQRAGLAMSQGKVIVSWGSFSDYGAYHGWMMAFDPASLQRVAIINFAPQYQSSDWASGPADHGGGASIWMGGAAPSVDDQGNIYAVAGDGSFNATTGGSNYGDSAMRITLDASGLHVADYYTPSNAQCLDNSDLEIGSGGVAVVEARNVGLSIDKSGKLYVINLQSMGHYSATSDAPQVVQVGADQCQLGQGGGYAEGPDWQRLYGNPAYWNGNVYVAPSNTTLKQFQFAGAALGTTPLQQSATVFGNRGANLVVSSNAQQSGIVWAYSKSASTGRAELHAYDATNVSSELWNSTMNAGRDSMSGGYSFGTPVVFGGHVMAGNGTVVTVYGELN